MVESCLPRCLTGFAINLCSTECCTPCEAQRGTEAVSLVRIDNEISGAILEPIRAITETKFMRLGRVEGVFGIGAGQGFTKQLRPICRIIGILVDKKPVQTKISAQCTVHARFNQG